MPEHTINPPEVDGRNRIPVEGDAAQPSLAAVMDEVRAQGASARRIQQGFAFFAVLALILALTNLIVVAAKLGDSKTTTRVVTAAAAPASAGTAKAAPALAHSVGVQLAEFSVRPTVAQAAAGKVTFAVHNGGQVTHEFVVVRTSKPAGSLLKGARADESGNVGETGDLQPGQSKKLSLNLPAGHYALICNLPGHYKAGQHVDFTVK
jgi:uncharacterized cupredoxin-like copper-binding protein